MVTKAVLDELKQFCQGTYKRKCFVAGNTILVNGDCLDVGYNIVENFGQIASCWINDPPYGTTSIAWDKVIPADDYWDLAEALTKPNSPLVVFGSQPFTSRLILSAENWFKCSLVWDKNKCGSPGLAKYRPMKTHEDVIVFGRKTIPYYPQMEDGEAYARGPQKQGTVNNHGYAFKREQAFTNTGTRYPKSILKFPRNFSAQQQLHPTQKPTTLLTWLLQSYSRKLDLVVDVTSGISTLGIAAYSIGRPCLCIEKTSRYFRTGRDWLSAVHNGSHWDAAKYRKALSVASRSKV